MVGAVAHLVRDARRGQHLVPPLPHGLAPGPLALLGGLAALPLRLARELRQPRVLGVLGRAAPRLLGLLLEPDALGLDGAVRGLARGLALGAPRILARARRARAHLEVPQARRLREVPQQPQLLQREARAEERVQPLDGRQPAPPQRRLGLAPPAQGVPLAPPPPLGLEEAARLHASRDAALPRLEARRRARPPGLELALAPERLALRLPAAPVLAQRGRGVAGDLAAVARREPRRQARDPEEPRGFRRPSYLGS